MTYKCLINVNNKCVLTIIVAITASCPGYGYHLSTPVLSRFGLKKAKKPVS